MSENKISENETSAGETPQSTEAVNNTAADVQETETAATSAIIKIEGQEFPLDVKIATDDELLKTALSPHYPSIKNAAVTRETRLGEMIVSIVKKAEHKGARQYAV